MDNRWGGLWPDERRIKGYQTFAALLSAFAALLSAYTNYVALLDHMLWRH